MPPTMLRPSRQPDFGFALIILIFVICMFLIPISYLSVREHLSNVRTVASAIVAQNHRCIEELNKTKNLTIPRSHGNLMNRLQYEITKEHIEVCVCRSTSYFASQHENADCRCAFQAL